MNELHRFGVFLWFSNQNNYIRVLPILLNWLKWARTNEMKIVTREIVSLWSPDWGDILNYKSIEAGEPILLFTCSHPLDLVHLYIQMNSNPNLHWATTWFLGMGLHKSHQSLGDSSQNNNLGNKNSRNSKMNNKNNFQNKKSRKPFLPGPISSLPNPPPKFWWNIILKKYYFITALMKYRL